MSKNDLHPGRNREDKLVVLKIEENIGIRSTYSKAAIFKKLFIFIIKHITDNECAMELAVFEPIGLNQFNVLVSRNVLYVRCKGQEISVK